MSRHLAVAAVLAVLLAGCSDDPEPQIADPTSDPPTSSPPPESAPPTSPPTQDPEPLSPEETARAWVEALNEMVTTGEVQRFRELSDIKCNECSQLIESVQDTYLRGGSTRTRGWSIASVKRVDDFKRSRRVAAGIEAARAVTHVPDDKQLATPADKFIIEVALKRSASNNWLVTELDFLS